MGSCIICGSSVDGRICDLHQEDVVFEFRGSSPDELTVNRYYRGTVDGYAEFGVFVDIGDSVTGLLHRSELDQRLESLDWDAGDAVFVKVKEVRDNGNVDLGWSIRQAESEFRGTLIDDPDEGAPTLKRSDDATDAADSEADADAGASDETLASESGETTSSGSSETGSVGGVDRAGDTPETGDVSAASASAGGSEPAGEGGATAAGSSAGASGAVVEDPSHVDVGDLDDLVGDAVRIEGVVESVRQTSGPTVFEIRDETGAVECAAFKEAGVRAYPEIGTDDVVRLDGEVRERRGELQVETEALVLLEGEDRDAVQQRLEDALEAQARPGEVEPLADDSPVADLTEDITDVATAIRRAVIEERPIVVRHRATADGYVAGVALERATLPLVRDQHQQHDATYHYFDRRPLEDGVYDMDDATKDLTDMLDARERHGEKLPLFVFVDAGGSRESLDGFELLDLYGAGRALVDDVPVDPEVGDAVGTLVAPAADNADTVTATTLAANVGAHVNEDVRADLRHLPAVSFWTDTPQAYADLASEAGYDDDATREIREAVALKAFYQSYEDKRELITDLLFVAESDGRGLASHVSEQFREKVAVEVTTAEANLDHQTVDGQEIAILDTDAFTHRYEFPPTKLLLDELQRRHGREVAAVIGVGEDELHIRSTTSIDVRDVADRASEIAESAGLTAKSARDGTLEYLAGERSAVLDAVVQVVADEL